MAWTKKEEKIAIELISNLVVYKDISKILSEAGFKRSPEAVRKHLARQNRGFQSVKNFKVSNHVTKTKTNQKPSEVFLRPIKKETKIHGLSKSTDGLSNTIHLVIPDPHSKPGVSNERFEWIGKLIADLKPDVVINLGDFADMESLCSYDKKKGIAENRKVKEDIESVIDAQEKMFNPEVCKLRDSGQTRFVLTLGNHENRIKRAVIDSPELEGFLSIDNLKYKEFGWEVYPYLDRVIIDDIAYSHYFPSGVMNKAIGGENPASSVIKKQFMSCTMGHSHIRDFAEKTKADGNRIQGLVAGCFFDHEEDYAMVSNSLWWRGVIIKRYVRDGMYEPEFLPIERLKQLYS